MMVIQTSFINPEESILLKKIHQALSSILHCTPYISKKNKKKLAISSILNYNPY